MTFGDIGMVALQMKFYSLECEISANKWQTSGYFLSTLDVMTDHELLNDMSPTNSERREFMKMKIHR